MPGEMSIPALQKRISELESERVRLLESLVVSEKSRSMWRDMCLRAEAECDTLRQELEKVRGAR